MGPSSWPLDNGPGTYLVLTFELAAAYGRKKLLLRRCEMALSPLLNPVAFLCPYKTCNEQIFRDFLGRAGIINCNAAVGPSICFWQRPGDSSDIMTKGRHGEN